MSSQHDRSKELCVSALAITSVSHHNRLPVCFTAHVGLPKCCAALTNCQDWCSSLDFVSSLPLSPPRQLFLRLGESKLYLGKRACHQSHRPNSLWHQWEFVKCYEGFANGLADLSGDGSCITAVLLPSCTGVCSHSPVWLVGATRADGAQPLAANSWSYSREVLLVKKRRLFCSRGNFECGVIFWLSMCMLQIGC